MATTTVTTTQQNIEIDIFDEVSNGTSIELPTIEEVLQMSTALIALLRNPVTLAEYELDPAAFVRKYTY